MLSEGESCMPDSHQCQVKPISHTLMENTVEADKIAKIFIHILFWMKLICLTPFDLMF